MHFAQVLFAVVGIASVSAAPLSVRTAATVESDISTILADLQSLDGKVKSFDGGIISGISFLSAYNSLRGSITSATTTVNSTGTLSAADSATIVTGLTPVVAEVQVVTTDLIAKVWHRRCTSPRPIADFLDTPGQHRLRRRLHVAGPQRAQDAQGRHRRLLHDARGNCRRHHDGERNCGRNDM